MDDMNEMKKEIRKLKDLNNNLMDHINEVEQEKKFKKNLNFVQLYKQHLMDLRRLTSKDSNALTILLIMVEKMNKQNALVISQRNLEKITGKSRTTVHRAIKVLREERFIEVIKIGTANAYVVNANVFWQDDHEKKNKFAIFDATVVASLDEQDQEYQENWDGIKIKSIPVLNDEIPLNKGKKYLLNGLTKEIKEIKEDEGE